MSSNWRGNKTEEYPFQFTADNKYDGCPVYSRMALNPTYCVQVIGHTCPLCKDLHTTPDEEPRKRRQLRNEPTDSLNIID
jgi:hypothetical protein